MVTIVIRNDDNTVTSFPDVDTETLAAVKHALSGTDGITIPAVTEVAVYSDSGACLCTSLSQDVRNKSGNCLWCGHAEHYSRAFCGALR